MKVIVNPTNTISTRVSQVNQQVVYSTSTFVGSTNNTTDIQNALDTANAALAFANTALFTANDAYALANTANTNITIISNELSDNTFDCGLF
jgi:hypothetical protein